MNQPDPIDPLPRCPYCKDGGNVRMAHHHEIYGGRSFGTWPWVYLCDCGARVGMHPGTNCPLGTLANTSTRKARAECKAVFNRIWREGHMSRTRAYQWLAKQMGIRASDCHWGMFSQAQCGEAAAICEAYLTEVCET